MALEFVTENKYLGVIITADLRWNRHVADVMNRANKVLGMIRRNFYFCDKKTKEAAYVALVRPLLEYASAVWDPHTASLASELEKIQGRAARFVTSNYLNFEHETMTRHLTNLGWRSLRARRTSCSQALFNDGLNGESILPLGNLSTPLRSTRHHHSKHFNIPFAGTEVYKNSFVPRVLRWWNSLLQSLIDVSSSPGLFQARLTEL